MTSKELSIIECRIRKHVISFGVSLLSYHKLETEARLAMTSDENLSIRKIIKVNNLDTRNDAATKESLDEAALKRILQKTLRIEIRKVMKKAKTVKLDGTVSYTLNGEDCFFITLDIKVTRTIQHVRERPENSRTNEIDNVEPVASTSNDDNSNNSDDENGSSMSSFEETNVQNDAGTARSAARLPHENEADPDVIWKQLEKRLTYNGRSKIRFYTEEFYNAVKVKINSEKRPFPCDICEESCPNIQSYQAHRYYKHDCQCCLLCTKKFKHKSAITRHVIDKHSPYKFPCRICSKKYSSRGTAKNCVRSHQHPSA